jgi:RNA polymerase sigma-70 factor (ECF subfamily)
VTPPDDPAGSLRRTVAAVYRRESGAIIARLARIVRDVGVAEELAQDALVAALQQWPTSGIPDNPAAWLVATAKHHAINFVRRSKVIERKHDELAHAAELRERPMDDFTERIDDPVGDDLLRLVFIACHPILAIEARVALTLRMLGGLTTDELARAFLVSEPTMAQRIVRAKRALAEAGVAFELPPEDELAERMSSVLGVIYLVFNEGYTATSGDDWMRPELCEEAMRLGRILAHLVPDEPEVHGLVALMELTASRTPARTDASGAPVLLLDQDRGRWDALLLHRGLASLARAEAFAGERGGYTLQAAIAACHARARTAADTDWARIAALYAELAAQVPSPVVRLHHAVAVGMAEGPAAGLALVDALAGEPALARYHPLPTARADLLEKLGRLAEARAEFERAAALTQNTRERDVLLARAAGCDRSTADERPRPKRRTDADS